MSFRQYINDALIQSIHEFPYNSFGKLLLAHGKNYPRNLGGNCVMQARNLAEKIRERVSGVYNIDYTTAIERPHWVTIASQDTERYMLDTFILHKQPIEIDAEDGEYESYPQGINTVLLRRTPKHNYPQIRLVSNGHPLLTYTYTSLGETQTTLPPDDYQIIAHLRQKRLELGCISVTGDSMRIFQDLLSGKRTSKRVGVEEAIDGENSELFSRHLEEISDTVSVSSRAILACMNEARGIYLSKVPL